jgi:hypothetical protein
MKTKDILLVGAGATIIYGKEVKKQKMLKVLLAEVEQLLEQFQWEQVLEQFQVERLQVEQLQIPQNKFTD